MGRLRRPDPQHRDRAIHHPVVGDLDLSLESFIGRPIQARCSNTALGASAEQEMAGSPALLTDPEAEAMPMWL